MTKTAPPSASLLAAALLPVLLSACPSAARAQGPSPVPDTVVAAAPGRVEGAGRVVDVGTAASGVVASVLVSEGDSVSKGQPLATLDCAVTERELEASRADVRVAEATLARLRNGARREEILASAAAVEAAEARAREALTARERQRSLRNTVSRASVEQAERDADMAVALASEARFRHAVLENGTRKDEIAEGEARVAAAAARVGVAEAAVDRCTVRAPSDGTVLHADVLPGNLVAPMVSAPLFRMVDASGTRVRAEVDEYDVGKVCAGQRATVRSDSYPGAELAAEVVSANPGMGRRTVLSGNPAEKADRDVREVVLRVDGRPGWPVGLRVVALFEGGDCGAKDSRPAAGRE